MGSRPGELIQASHSAFSLRISQATAAAAMHRVSKISFVLLVFVGASTAQALGGLAGGVGAVQGVDAETQELLSGVRGDVEQALGSTVSEFTVLSYSTQVVSGRNYFAKVRTGPNEYIHIRVYSQPWTGTLALHGLLRDKTEQEPIVSFETNLLK